MLEKGCNILSTRLTGTGSKKVKKEADTITQLLNENNRFDRISYRPAIERIGIIRPVKEYEAFGSRTGAFNGVMATFEDCNASIIGVQGMGGVGKTTLVKEAARQAKEKQLFDEVVLVAITQTPNRVIIQNEIAEKIGLTITEKSVEVRAARLRERQKKEKKVIIILDDIWVTLDLEALGIPSGDEHKGCKILMTSRRYDLQSAAVEVAKRCAVLPIAKALKRKQNLYEWENVLEQLNPLKSTSGGSRVPIMCHNAAIQDLLKHCRGWGLFHGLGMMEKVRNQVLALASELKDSSLLLSGSTPERFDMHDVVRDVTISIASRDHRWLALGEEDVFEECELPNELESPNLTFFSMYGNVEVPNDFFKGMQRLKVLKFAEMRFTSLPSSIGSLKTLCTLCLIDCDLDDIVIPAEMENLEILDLRGSSVTMLPKEIGQLTKLKLLDLSNCYNLKVISPMVLTNLSRIEELYLYDNFDKWEVDGSENPRTNASLVELQHLSNLTTSELHIPDVQAIPKNNLFSGKIERYEISIGDQWYPYKKGMETSRLLKLEMDKNGLSNLKHFDVSNVSDTNVVINSMMLVSCLESLSLYNLIYLEAICDYQLKAESFGRLRVIKVNSCNMLKNLFSFSIAKGLRQLQELKVSCPTLKELDLDSINGIEKLWHYDQHPIISFGVQCLTSSSVNGCHGLKYVCTLSMVKSLVHLKRLLVSHCDQMEEVIEGMLTEESSSNSVRVFPKRLFDAQFAPPTQKILSWN
ncbi:hypothetical protein F3Y22_tig00110602pilonHSYRG00230 [Hibiscus syriacus]|uniref:AAA+ ATPase domain-containing protein n=1 Tax=Hibiscus syriacus TaxID=106335 RepID=A0A6A3A4H8_HIBSY|nr:hypothetical protein F3Y22_tig00110602pilonHSYRG00230 [Hibiscus syriacus]